MKFSRDPNYEAAFVRVADHDESSPEELERKQRRATLVKRLAIGVVVVVALAGAGFAVFSLRRDSPEKQVARGIQYGKTNAHIAAVIEFKRSLQTNPDQPAVRVLLGQELSILSDARSAEIEFQKAVNAKFELDRTMPLLVESMLHQGKFDQVIAAVNDASIESPEANSELLAMRGAAYFAIGREAEAQTSWNAAKEFVPGHAPTLVAQARALSAKGRFDEAGKVLDGIAPGAPQMEVLSLRGEIARATGKPLEAVAAYQAALAIEPTNLFVRTNLAQTLVELGRYDDAALDIKKVLNQMPAYPNGLFVSALAEVGRKNYEKANDAIVKAVQLLPTDGRFELLAGTLAMQLGQRAEAEQYLNAAVIAMPQNADARRLLALLYVDKRDTKRADQVFKPVFDSFRGNQEIATIAARIAIQQGNTQKAAAAFDQVDPSNPKNVDATLMAASLKIKAGDKAGGFARLRAAAAASPDNTDVDAAIIVAHLTFNETNEALAQWKVLSRKEPDGARTFNLLAGIELARGDKAAARRSLEQASAADPKFLAPVSGLAMLDLGDKKIDDAKDRLKRFSVTNPDNAEATMLRVELEKSSGAKVDAVVGILRDAHKANPRSAQITYALALSLLQSGDRSGALVVANEGLTATPNDIALLQFVGDQSLIGGDTDRAIALFTKLQDLNASSADYATSTGIALVRGGKYEEALAAFRLALGRNPNGTDRQFAMVGSFSAAGRANEAQRIYYEIARVSPNSPILPELDADVKLQLKQYPEAIDAYRKALAQRPSQRLAVKTANALLVARQRGEALLFLTEWLKAHPTDEQVRTFDAETAMRGKDYLRASNGFRTLVAAHPNDPLMLNNLAWNLNQINDAQALPIAEKASTLAPDDPAVNDTLGWMLVAKGDAARGLALIEKASVAAPKDLDIRVHLAKAQLKQGKGDAARETLKGVVASAPESEQAKASQALLASF